MRSEVAGGSSGGACPPSGGVRADARSRLSGGGAAHPTKPQQGVLDSPELSEEEQARVEQVADAKHLPASTLVRSWILDRLNQEETA